MPKNSAVNTYKEQAILNAPRLKLVQMLYDEAITALKRACVHLEKGEEMEFRSVLIKGQAIVGELFASLNYIQGKEIANDLAALYQFSIAQLMDANVNKTKSSIEAVLRVLSTLEQGWDNITDNEGA